MIVRLAAVITLVAVLAATAAAQSPISPGSPGNGPYPPLATYMPVPPPADIPVTQQTPSPAITALTPAPLGSPAVSPPPNLLEYTGQLLDVRNGYVYFTSGDAFPAIAALRIVTYETGLPTTVRPQAKMFARATFDPATKHIVELAITRKRLETQDVNILAGYAVVKSKGEAAPEIAGQHVTGRPVAVVFEITAPPTTNVTDTLYISTDASAWNPQAIKLDRVDAYLYRAQRYFASGTRFAYRVTRGTWTSVERGQDGLDPAPHQFFVREVDSLAARVTVYHWSDENPSQPQAGPNSLPTPYNSNPFGGGPGGIQVPQKPTPQPTRLP